MIADFLLLRADERSRSYGDAQQVHDSGRVAHAPQVHDFAWLDAIERTNASGASAPCVAPTHAERGAR